MISVFSAITADASADGIHRGHVQRNERFPRPLSDRLHTAGAGMATFKFVYIYIFTVQDHAKTWEFSDNQGVGGIRLFTSDTEIQRRIERIPWSTSH